MNRKFFFAQPVYQFGTWLLLPFVLIHLIYRTSRDGGLIYLKQRLGFATPKLGKAIWLHAASVGEANTAQPIIRALSSGYPDIPLLVTTNTPTGRAAIERASIANVHVSYLPLDYAFAVSRFMQNNQLLCALIIETEIWPLLYAQCYAPLVILNGRVSERTLKATGTGVSAKIYQQAAAQISKVLARNNTDASGFIRLGVDPDRVKTLGNLKFAGVKTSSTRSSKETLGFSREFCLLASTHENEEEQLVEQWLKHNRTELLVIAPRHPDRRASLIRQLTKIDKNICVRSRKDTVLQGTAIYLADTLGEMHLWYAHAKSIFLGGSLVAKGGHNMIEPALYKQSVVIGPHFHNFTDEVSEFLRDDAIVQMNDAEGIVQAMLEIADTSELRRRRGESARAITIRFGQIGDDYFEEIKLLLDASMI